MKITVFFDQEGKPLHGISRYADRKTNRYPTLCGLLAPSYFQPKKRHLCNAETIVFACAKCQMVLEHLHNYLEEEKRAFPQTPLNGAPARGDDDSTPVPTDTHTPDGSSPATGAPVPGRPVAPGEGVPPGAVDNGRDPPVAPGGGAEKPGPARTKPRAAKGKSRRNQG
jgi:hypothetical protein